MTEPLTIPVTDEDLTPAWINAVLNHTGHDVEVANVEVSPIGTGQMASSLRVAITYANSSDAPPSVVVKIASPDPNSRAAGARGAYLREVRYYQELDADLGVATPRSYWSAVDTETHDFALVLEDMHPAEQGDQIQGCDTSSVIDAARNIAGLHAPRWGDEALFDLPWLTVPRAEQLANYQEAKALVAMVTPGFIDRYRTHLDDRHVGLLEWFAENVDSWLANDGGRFGLTHGDHRLDNLLFNPADTDRPVTVVDWQTVAVRNPVADISYLLGTSVEAQTRREIESEVVGIYHQRLCELGVDGYSQADCFDDYRTQTPQSLLLTVLGSMLTVQTDRGDAMFMAMLHRSSEQIFDLR